MMKYEQEFYENVKHIANVMEEQKKLREDCKIKLFKTESDETTEEEMNDFIKDKILVDIKLSEAGSSNNCYSRTVIVIYKDKK